MRSKGQSMELMEILIAVTGVCVLLIISYFLFGSRGSFLSEVVTESNKYDKMTDVVNEFYTSKIAGTQRTLSQLLADRIIAKNPVIYGKKFGNIDVDNQTAQFFNSYFGKNWRFEVKSVVYDVNATNQSSSEAINLGYRIPNNIRRLQTFEVLIPVPTIENEIWKGYLYVW
jgi:hypothetical protein